MARRIFEINPTTKLRSPFIRVGIYCRVSSSNPAQLESASQQVSYMTQLVSGRNDWKLQDTYMDFVSGTHMCNRKSFMRMVGDCKAGKLDLILTRNVSRFGRNTEEILEQLRTLKDCGVEVRFVQEELVSTESEHELIISIIAALATADNASRRENIMWGIERQLENGTSSIYSRPCYGYVKNKYGELEIEPHQEKIVQLIFDLYQEGKSVLGIIKELDLRHIPSPSGNTKWCKRSVENILDNEKYCGNVIVVKTYEISTPEKKRVRNRGERKKYYAVGTHPAIITQEQFDLIQAERKARTNLETTESGKKRKSTRYSSK